MIINSVTKAISYRPTNRLPSSALHQTEPFDIKNNPLHRLIQNKKEEHMFIESETENENTGW